MPEEHIIVAAQCLLAFGQSIYTTTLQQNPSKVGYTNLPTKGNMFTPSARLANGLRTAFERLLNAF